MKKAILTLCLITMILSLTGCSLGGGSSSTTDSGATAATKSLTLSANLGSGVTATSLRAVSIDSSNFKFRVKAMNNGEPTGDWTEVTASANPDGTFGAQITVANIYTEFITELLYTDGSSVVSAIQNIAASGTTIVSDSISTVRRIAFEKWKVSKSPVVKAYSNFTVSLTPQDITAIGNISSEFATNISGYISYISGVTTASPSTFLNEWTTSQTSGDSQISAGSTNTFASLDHIVSMISVDPGITDPGAIASNTVSEGIVSTSANDVIYNPTTSASWAPISGTNSTLSETGKIAPYEFSASDSDVSYDANSSTLISLNNSSTQIVGTGASFANGVVTITAAGSYVLSGNLDGHIIVSGKIESGVTLILNGVTISGQTHAAIYSDEKKTPVSIILVSGTTNTLSDATTYTYHDDDEPGACLFAKGDLVIKGAGSLTVDGKSSENGIQSKGKGNGLVITGGAITVTTSSNGIKAKRISISGGTFKVNTASGECFETTDSDIYITGGDFNLTSTGGDTMKAENDWEDDASVTPAGNVYICGGNFNLKAFGDAIQATKELVICGGKFDVTTTNAGFDASNESSKGIKTGTDSQAGELIINGGDFTFNTTDHAIKSKGAIEVYGNPAIRMSSTLGKGISGTGDVTIGKSGLPKIYVTYASEGIESKSLLSIKGGDIRIYAPAADSDGLNAGGTTTAGIVISGGYIYIEVNGDGVDTNSNLTISGGTLISNASYSTNPNAAIDTDEGTFTFTGGFVVGLGSSDMSNAPDSAVSSIPSLNINFSGMVTKGRLIHIRDSAQNELITCFAAQDSNSLVVSSSKIIKGETYSIYTGGSHNGFIKDGVFTGGSYTPGLLYNTFTQTDTTTTFGTPMNNFGGPPGGMGEGGVPGGMPGGLPGGMPGGMPGEFLPQPLPSML